MSNELILVPELGGNDAVDVIEIVVAVGDTVAIEDTLIVVESEKATVEIPSPKGGTIKAIKVAVGDSINTGDPLVELDVSEDAASEVPKQPSSTKDEVIRNEDATTKPEAHQSKSDDATPHKSTPLTAPLSGATSQLTTASDAAVYAGPAVRRLAREMGVDLTQVMGTGVKGRVTKDDLKAHVKQRLSTAGGAGGLAMNLPVIDFSQFGEISEEALTGLRRTAAENLHRSWLTIPAVTHQEEADITELEVFRRQTNQQISGTKVTLLAFLVKVVASALQRYPRFNSSLSSDGSTLVFKHYVNIGIAVDTEHGLMVPVIRDADKKGVHELAQDIEQLAEKARLRKLAMADMQGGCFTISSLGGIGGGYFSPIINWPEVAILGVGRSKKQPYWNGETFEPRDVLPLSLSYDHRVVDGADAARFAKYISEALGDLRHLLL